MEDHNNNGSDALTTITQLASRLRDTAAGIADKANQAAGAPEHDHSDEDFIQDAWSSADFGTLIALIGQLGEAIPSELRARLGTSVEEVLITTRDLIDWYLSRDPDPDKSDLPEDGPPAA
jgi:hypothetical protein